MLTHLFIRDVVLIKELDLSLKSGLTVLTGETGAGKSILLDSLGLALGKRATGEIIRKGAEQSHVSASFDLPPSHAVFDFLLSQGLAKQEQGEPVILRRVITQDGRSRAYINDQAVGITTLRNAASLLVEIQGQHAQVGLTDQTTHRDLLDSFGVEEKTRLLVENAFETWKKSAAKLKKAKLSLEKSLQEEEWLRQTVDDLSKIAPQEGEEEKLAAQRVSLQQDERRSEAIAAAISELTPKDRRTQGPAASLRGASRALSRLLPSGIDAPSVEFTSPLQEQTQEALEALNAAEEALSHAETLLSRLASESIIDMSLLEETEERLFTLRAEARKHNISVQELPLFLKKLEEQLLHIDNGNAEISQYEEETKEARNKFEEAAESLSLIRQKAAILLEKAVMSELAPLKLERAKFIVSLTELPAENWNRFGKDDIAFLISANPGQEPGALGKVASGGELSRLMLALKVVLAGRSSLTTLVFDEVDSGVGGATASAIGERLQRVAQNIQVLAITHSPQVASCGQTQLRISKKVIDKETHTSAEPLSEEERLEEIARMLAGDKITDAARAAAHSLLRLS